MAETTANLNLPFILPSQAQKHVTHNEALLTLDALVHLAILEEASAPPADPTDGAAFLVGIGPAGVWAGHEKQVAVWQDGHGPSFDQETAGAPGLWRISA